MLVDLPATTRPRDPPRPLPPPPPQHDLEDYHHSHPPQQDTPEVRTVELGSPVPRPPCDLAHHCHSFLRRHPSSLRVCPVVVFLPRWFGLGQQVVASSGSHASSKQQVSKQPGARSKQQAAISHLPPPCVELQRSQRHALGDDSCPVV